MTDKGRCVGSQVRNLDLFLGSWGTEMVRKGSWLRGTLLPANGLGLARKPGLLLGFRPVQQSGEGYSAEFEGLSEAQHGSRKCPG